MPFEMVTDWLSGRPAATQLLSVLGVLLLSFVAFILAKKLILTPLRTIIRKSSAQWDNSLLQRGVFSRLLYLIPLLILYNFAYLVPQVEQLLQRILAAVTILVIILTLGAFFNAISEIYYKSPLARRLDIKSYLQVVKLLVYIFGVIIIISVLIGRSPWLMLSGIGAMTAVLLLIFRDTILSFVASIQISSSDMVRVGDWIEVPAFGADGDVIDIALHTVQVQNWDKTITVIPTYKLLDSSFKNWRGMSQSGGRRIKRAIYIDVSTIRLCDEELLQRFEKFRLLTDYIREKRDEIARYNREHQVDDSQLINGRRLTNVGTFRAYVEAYLRDHPQIHQDMTLLVRQLDPGPNGLPIEIYAFTSDTRWGSYEAIQADIFDHILAVVPEFDLRVFQEPAGKDFEKLAGTAVE
ncbi:mechanosensitive ion channel family protein [Candidatus Neomarinimicrobiota bacterium]